MNSSAIKPFGRGPLAAPFSLVDAQKNALSALQQVENSPKTLCASRQSAVSDAHKQLKNKDKTKNAVLAYALLPLWQGKAFRA
ncbi:hypothetical protein [Rhodoblastus sp.]|jgi:hypothetical protein|uniref:hypothetical protein n=1 Tax=Rhodoblastus sp. TaxID=1962975 RepID=UPI0025E52B55|nr:hypothetical protein [Rhodoblastus sp.]